MEPKEYTISILVENSPGVLSQVSRLFSRKGYNIDSIASGTTEDPRVTRITIVMQGDEVIIGQITAQLRKLLDGTELAISESQERMAVVVAAEDADAFIGYANAENLEATVVAEVTEEPRLRMTWKGHTIVDISRETLTVVILGSESKAGALMDLLADFGILEVVRTGTIAIERGRNTIYDNNKEKGEFDYGKNVL